VLVRIKHHPHATLTYQDIKPIIIISDPETFIAADAVWTVESVTLAKYYDQVLFLRY
jgi:hypothetical protein